nr:immunoglobulin light chain junction region [Macaca mulatta]
DYYCCSFAATYTFVF